MHDACSFRIVARNTFHPFRLAVMLRQSIAQANLGMHNSAGPGVPGFGQELEGSVLDDALTFDLDQARRLAAHAGPAKAADGAGILPRHFAAEEIGRPSGRERGVTYV